MKTGAAYWKQTNLTDLQELAEMDKEYSGQTDGGTMHLWHITNVLLQNIKALRQTSCLNLRINLKSELSLH